MSPTTAKSTNTDCLPHIAIWSALVSWTLATLKEMPSNTDRDAAIAHIEQYIKHLETLAMPQKWQLVHSQVPYVIIAKSYYPNTKKLLIHVRPNTDSSKIYAVFRELFLKHQHVHLLPGCAPPGAMARKIQEWVTNHSEKAEMEG